MVRQLSECLLGLKRIQTLDSKLLDLTVESVKTTEPSEFPNWPDFEMNHLMMKILEAIRSSIEVIRAPFCVLIRLINLARSLCDFNFCSHLS